MALFDFLGSKTGFWRRKTYFWVFLDFRPKLLLGLEPALGIFTEEVFLVMMSNESRDSRPGKSIITKRAICEIIRLMSRKNDHTIGCKYELCFPHIHVTLDWMDSVPC